MLSSQYKIQQNMTLGNAGIQIFEDINTSADQSVRFGEGAGKLSFGTGNAFMGYQAGEQNLGGSYVTFIGYQAGQLNQSSSSTTLVGAFAGRQNTNGNETVFVGFRAGEFNLNGNQNVGVGAFSLRENNSGSGTTAVGWAAAERNLDGDYNTMIGAEAGQNNRSGNYNTMAGYRVGRAAFSGSENTFFGAYAGYSNELGSDNCIIGFKAGLDVINADFNIAIGAYALSTGRINSNIPSDCNVVIGAFTNTTGSGNVVLGLNAGSNSSGDDNVLIGKDVALSYDGHKSVIVGSRAITAGSGECNTMIGYGIGPNFNSGSNNVLIGVGANTYGEDTSYTIAIGTSNVRTYTHSISIGDALDNKRRETISIGFDINTVADNSVIIGKTLNINNAKVFKDPLNYPYIATIDTKADELFGPTDIGYSYLLLSPSNIIYPVAGAGQFTSNIVSSRGNRRTTIVSQAPDYDLITGKGQFDRTLIHYGSVLFLNTLTDVTTTVPTSNLINYYNKYGTFDITSNITSIGSVDNLYSNQMDITLSYSFGYSNVSNVVTNLTQFNTSNTTYSVYLQKQVQNTSIDYALNNIPTSNTVLITNGPLDGSVAFGGTPVTTTFVGDGISPFSFDSINTQVKYVIHQTPRYGMLNTYLLSQSCSNAIFTNSCNLTSNITYTPFHEYAYAYSNIYSTSSSGDTFSIKPFLQIAEANSNVYGITNVDIAEKQLYIERPSYGSNIIIRNSIVLSSDSNLHTFRFTSNDFMGVPNGLDDTNRIIITGYDTTNFDLYTPYPSEPYFTYSNLKQGHAYLTQKIPTLLPVTYNSITGVMVDNNDTSNIFSITMSSIPTSIINITPSYTIPLIYTSSTVASDIYTLQNIPLDDVWMIQGSSNADLQIPATITNLNQCTYRRINPFVKTDTVKFIGKSNQYLQEIDISFSNTNNFIYNTITQAAITTDLVTTYTSNYVYTACNIQTLPILNTSNLFTSNFTSNISTDITTLNSSSYNPFTFALSGSYNSNYGYSNIWAYYSISNIYPIDPQTVASPNGEITIISTIFTSNLVYSIDGSLLGIPEYTSNSYAPSRVIPNIVDPTSSYTSNIIHTYSNTILLTQASNYVFSNIQQQQHTFYYYGLIHTYQDLLLYTSNTTSNVSAKTITSPQIPLSSNAVLSGINNYTNTTSNILEFVEHRNSNAVIPVTRAMMFKEGGAFAFQTKNGFDILLSNQGIVPSWTQSQIDNGGLYLQLPSITTSPSNKTFTITETTTSKNFTNTIRLYNSNTISVTSLVPTQSNLTYLDRYTSGGKSVRSIYNLNTIANDLTTQLGIDGFTASEFDAIYLNNDVDYILLDSSLKQTYGIPVSGNGYLLRTNQNHSNIDLYLFGKNSSESTITNIIKVPIAIDEIPSSGIKKQGVNYGISVGNKNKLDSQIFSHSWSNLHNSNLKINITTDLDTFDFKITSNHIPLTNTNNNKYFTQQDCLAGKIVIEPLTAGASNAFTYELIDTNTSTVLVPNLAYNISAYEYYAFPTNSEVGNTSYLTTLLYGSNLAANVFSSNISSTINSFTYANGSNVNKADLYMYIEKAPTRGALYDSIQSNIPYKLPLNQSLRYLSYTPDDIHHDTVSVRIGYRTSNISPLYSIGLSNYALPFANMAIEAGRYSSNYPIRSLVVSSGSNINRYIADGNSFSSNYLPIPASTKLPLHSYSYPITLYGKQGETLASNNIVITPYALSTKPVLSTTSMSLHAAQYSQTSLKSMLGLLTNYDWNGSVDFVLTSNVLSARGVVMKKSYTSGSFTLTPVSHFTNDELNQDLVVYQHIGSTSGTQVLTDSFTCYATNGPYSYNSNLITVNINIDPLPYVKTISDDYVYYNTTGQALVGVNPLKNMLTVGTTTSTVSTSNVSFSVVHTSNVDIVDIGMNSNIVNIFSVEDLENGTIGYKIKQNFLQASNYDNLWPFSITVSPNGLPSSTSSNELVNISQYSSMFGFDMRGALNIYESSNVVIYEPNSNQNLTYTFASSEIFANNPVDIMFQVKPAQSISTTGMPGLEFLDSSNLRTFQFEIKLRNDQPPGGSNIFYAVITQSNITIHEPIINPSQYSLQNTIVFDEWNLITISSVNRVNNNKASITINSSTILLNNTLNVNDLKYIAITTNETDPKNFTNDIMLVNTTNPYGNIPLSYYITNYASTIYLRNFEIDIFTPYNTFTDYDPITNNVIIGKNITVKGTDNITIGKQFSTSGQNNIILGNYIGIDNTNVSGTNDVYESIIIGNNSFINGSVRDIIAIGNSNLNDLSGVDPGKLNDFISQKPILIGNEISNRYIDYHVNIANIFLKTNVLNSQVYVGLNNEKVAIGYDTNEGFTAYQDLYVKHGIYVGTTAPTNSNQQYALDIVGDVNITGNAYISGNKTITDTLTASNITASNITTSNLNFLGELLQNGQPYIGSQWTTSGCNIYYAGGSVGVGYTPNDIYSIDISGNINFTGNLYQNGVLYPIGGNGYGDGSNASNIWVHSSNVTGVLVPGSGVVSYSPTSNSIFRHSDNNVDYGFDLSFTITTGSGGVGDYKLLVPFEVDTSYYTNNSIIGSAWSRVITGSLSNYFPLSIRSPLGSHQSNVIVRFMNGTTETSLATLSDGTSVQLSGMFSYVSTSILPTIGGGGGGGTTWLNVVGGIYNSNLANVGIGTTTPKYKLDVAGSINFTSNIYQRDTLIDLTSISIIGSNLNKFNPWINTSNSPQLSLPSPGTVSYSSSSNSIYRHIDNDVEYAFNVTATITQTSGSGDYILSVPIPINLNYYTSNVIIGNIWSRVTSGALVNYIPVSVSTLGGSQSNAVAVRFINGTTETPMSILTTGNILQLSGTIEYVSSIYPRSGIFLSNVCYQDDYGHVGFNTFGPLRAQVDIVGDNKYTMPALYVEQVNPNSYGLYVSGNTYNTGSMTIGSNIYASNATIYNTLVTNNLTVLGSNTTINTYTISTSNVSICNITGIGPALSVSQKGVGEGYPIADFYDIDVSTTVPVFRIADGGNIGIGTTIPITSLHVQGITYFSSNVGIGTTIPRRFLDIQGGSMIISHNIGIGTTIPLSALHVQGQGYFSSNVGIGTTIPLSILHMIGTNKGMVHDLSNTSALAPYAATSMTNTGSTSSFSSSNTVTFPPTYWTTASISPYTSVSQTFSGQIGTFQNAQFTISASTAASSLNAVENAFDNGVNGWRSATGVYNFTTGVYTGSVSTGGVLGEWVQVQNTVYSFVATSYQINNSSSPSSPYTWDLYGSTDGSTWTLLDQAKNITTVGTITRTFTNSTAYSYYRIVIIAIQGSGSGGNTYARLYQFFVFGTSPLASAISFSNVCSGSYSSLHNGGTYTVTTNQTYYTVNTPGFPDALTVVNNNTALLDGSATYKTDAIFTSGADATLSCIIILQIPSDTYYNNSVTGYKITCDGTPTSAPSKWTVELSSNGSSYTQYDSQTNITSWSMNETKSYTFTTAGTGNMKYVRFTFLRNGLATASTLNITRLQLTTISVSRAITVDTNGVGIGTTICVNMLSINGGTSIGRSYANTLAPQDGLIISGNVGIGTSTTVNTLGINGSVSIGAYTNTAAPTNSLIISGNIGIGTTNPQSILHIANTSSNVPPLLMSSATVSGVGKAGSIEYDGTTLYTTLNTNYGRATIPAVIYTSGVNASPGITLNTNYPLFPAANDTITLPIGTYLVKLAITVTVATSTVGSALNINLGGGGNAVGSFSWRGVGAITVNGTTSSFPVAATALGTNIIVTANSAVAGRVYVCIGEGILKITTGGTIIPSYQFTATLTNGVVTLATDNYMILQVLDTQSAAAFGPVGCGFS